MAFCKTITDMSDAVAAMDVPGVMVNAVVNCGHGFLRRGGSWCSYQQHREWAEGGVTEIVWTPGLFSGISEKVGQRTAFVFGFFSNGVRGHEVNL